MTLIMGRPTLELNVLRANVVRENASPLFVDVMLEELWLAALRYGLDPLAVVAQAAHETGWGRFGRAMAEWHRNTCGVKVRNIGAVLAVLPAGSTTEHPLCHAQFATWEGGANAHCEHLRAYTQVPIDHEPIDPRYFIVVDINDETGRPPAVHLRDLDPWAGREGYGDSLENVAARLVRTSEGLRQW